jgi:hypothetical protein
MIAPEAFKVSATTKCHKLITSKTLATGPSITKRNLTYAQANRCEKLLLREWLSVLLVVADCFGLAINLVG